MNQKSPSHPDEARADRFAAERHQNHARKYTLEPYITHPREVRDLVAAAGGDLVSRMAALLHDTVEMGVASLAEIEAEFGQEVAGVVSGLTTPTRAPGVNRAEAAAAEVLRLQDCCGRTQTVKAADISSNARTIAPRDPRFAMIWLTEKRAQLLVLQKAEPSLLAMACELVEAGLDSLDAPGQPGHTSGRRERP